VFFALSEWLRGGGAIRTTVRAGPVEVDLSKEINQFETLFFP
jgi:hypothetical protein